MYHLLRWGAAALGLLVTSCQWISSVEVYQADPLDTGCVLPPIVAGAGKGRVRLANLFPSKSTVDICVRPTGAASYGRPILRNSGRETSKICGAGLKYAQVTAPFAVPAGTIDVKIIAATQTCSAAALAESIGIIDAGNDGPIRTLAYMGGATTAGIVVSMEETAKPTVPQNRKTRLVNAAPGLPLIFGTSDSPELPSTLAAKITKAGIEFGKAADTNSSTDRFDFDKNGYWEIGSIDINTVAVYSGSGTLKAVLQANQTGQGVQTIFAVGDANVPSFPVRGLLCKEGEINADEQLTLCTLTELETFAIDTFNAGLYGAFAVAEEKRADALVKALADRGTKRSDLICISEIARHMGLDLPPSQATWTQEHVIEEATKAGGYLYSAQATTDLNTSITDPATRDGTIPPAPTDPPCNPSVEDLAAGVSIDTAYKCLSTNCSTTGDDKGVTQGGTGCYASSCSGALVGWKYGNTAQNTCFNCMIGNGLSYLSWAKNKEICTTDKRTSYAFNGTSTSFMMSKYPLRDVDQYVEGSTLFRRTALYARMEYATNASIDVYCVHMTPLLGDNVPYTGNYDNGANRKSGAAWQEEQTWATQNVIDWIKRKSGDRPAIIAGDWSSSATAVDEFGNVINGPNMLPAVADVNADTVHMLRSAFFEAIPDEGYTPRCTRCPSGGSGMYHNPYNNITDPQLTERVFLKEVWGGNPTTVHQIFFDDLNAVDVDTMISPTGKGPLSDTFGLQVRIARP